MSEHTDQFDRPLGRQDELLADAVLVGLKSHEVTELESLLGAGFEDGPEYVSMERAAASVALAMVDAEPMPTGLAERIRGAVRETAQADPGPVASISSGGVQMADGRAAPGGSGALGMAGWMGWVAAAACFALAVFAWRGTDDGIVLPAPAEPGAVALFDTIKSQDDALVLEWGDWALEGEGPEIAGVSGEVVWDEDEQRGVMKFVGLPQNDTSEIQYQLWIIDRRGLFDDTGQSARISGGVFNSDGGEVYVPIDAALTVQGAAAFAITIEKPGGVWTSDMSRRVVIAAGG